MATLIKNGTLVTASETLRADFLIDGERIALIGRDLTAGDATVIDATGLYALPGGIDAHTHLDLPIGPGLSSSDDFYTGHKAAAFGGTTTHIDFATQDRGGTLRGALDAWHARAAGKAVIDYAFHLGVTELPEAALAEIPALPAEGVTSLKLYMAYKGRLMVDDGALFRALALAREHGLLTMVHAENGEAIDLLVAQAHARGDRAPEWHARTRPAWCETEATLRAIALAAIAGAPLYVVHVTCAGAVDQVRYGRAHGAPVMGETCPQYLFFTEDDLARPDFAGAKYVCSPPLRTAADQAALWRALQDGTLQTVATEHCPFYFDGTQPIRYEGRPVQMPGKELGRDDFARIPNGLPGIGDRLLVLWSEGVARGRLSPNRFVELTATNPAKIFGMYPRKGTLAPGSDADIALWAPAVKHTWGVAASQHRTDYNLYEGWELTGKPVMVFRRGELLVEGDTWHGTPGSGRYVAREAGALL
jgi:dihydropyrimidinase